MEVRSNLSNLYLISQKSPHIIAVETEGYIISVNLFKPAKKIELMVNHNTSLVKCVCKLGEIGFYVTELMRRLLSVAPHVKKQYAVGVQIYMCPDVCKQALKVVQNYKYNWNLDVTPDRVFDFIDVETQKSWLDYVTVQMEVKAIAFSSIFHGYRAVLCHCIDDHLELQCAGTDDYDNAGFGTTFKSPEHLFFLPGSGTIQAFTSRVFPVACTRFVLKFAVKDFEQGEELYLLRPIFENVNASEYWNQLTDDLDVTLQNSVDRVSEVSETSFLSYLESKMELWTSISKLLLRFPLSLLQWMLQKQIPPETEFSCDGSEPDISKPRF